jgi:mono/diheme cytochrome c family protein
MQNIIGLMALKAIALLLVWSAFRARRLRKGFLRWSSVGLASLLALAVASVSALTVAGMIKQHARRAPAVDLAVEATPDRIARGKALVDGFCSACHSKNGVLTGGVDIGEHFPIRVGSFVSSNLTPAGSLQHWSDGEIFRAIRNGVDPDGRWLVIMSYTNAGKLSDEDIRALIAYIRSVPAAGAPTPVPPDRLNLLGLAMLGAGMLPGGKPVISGSITAPPKGPTVEFGEYILSYQDCRECHGADLAGGVQGQMAPIGPGLGMVKDWQRAEFIAAMRTGIDPSGHQMSELMPWRTIGRMDDDELAAIYAYLTHLPGS